jgi:hypothetical protein
LQYATRIHHVCDNDVFAGGDITRYLPKAGGVYRDARPKRLVIHFQQDGAARLGCSDDSQARAGESRHARFVDDRRADAGRQRRDEHPVNDMKHAIIGHVVGQSDGRVIDAQRVAGRDMMVSRRLFSVLGATTFKSAARYRPRVA